MVSPRKSIEKLKALISDYGPIAICVYLVLWALALVVFFAAVMLGFKPEGATGIGGLLFASWISVKLTQPARIALTAVLTPIIAKWLPSSRTR